MISLRPLEARGLLGSQDDFHSASRSGGKAPTSGSTLDSKFTSNLQDNICAKSVVSRSKGGRHTLGGGPARQRAGEFDTNHLRRFQFPRQVGHDIDSISTANTNSNHTKTAGVGSVRVSADHQATGESIILKDAKTNQHLCSSNGSWGK